MKKLPLESDEQVDNSNLAIKVQGALRYLGRTSLQNLRNKNSYEELIAAFLSFHKIQEFISGSAGVSVKRGDVFEKFDGDSLVILFLPSLFLEQVRLNNGLVR